MLKNFVLQIIAALAGLGIAVYVLPDVEFTGRIEVLLIAGVSLGVANAILKPVLNVLTLPIRILTLGLSGLAIDILIVWLVDIYVPELVITGILPLLWIVLIVWGASFILHLLT